jgi:hypothetical protein
VPVPMSNVELQRFLGMINFYRRFMPLLAAKLNPLHEATPCKGPSITWTANCNVAFAAAKTALATATLLHHPDPSVPTSVTVDASGAGLGAELAQLQAGIWRPICFFSRKLSSAETKYSAFDRELLAIYEAIKYFRHHVESKPLTIYTEHMPLTFAFSSASDRSPCQTNHLSYVAEFTTDVCDTLAARTMLSQTCSRAPCARPPQWMPWPCPPSTTPSLLRTRPHQQRLPPTARPLPASRLPTSRRAMPPSSVTPPPACHGPSCHPPGPSVFSTPSTDYLTLAPGRRSALSPPGLCGMD